MSIQDKSKHLLNNHTDHSSRFYTYDQFQNIYKWFEIITIVLLHFLTLKMFPPKKSEGLLYALKSRLIRCIETDLEFMVRTRPLRNILWELLFCKSIILN